MNPENKKNIYPLSEEEFEVTYRNEARKLYKATVLKERLKKWLNKKIINYEFKISELLELLEKLNLDIKEESKKYFEKGKKYFRNQKEIKNDINVIVNQLDWFLKIEGANKEWTIDELIKYLENIIKESQGFLESDFLKKIK